jgi:streptogramin lyase
MDWRCMHISHLALTLGVLVLVCSACSYPAPPTTSPPQSHILARISLPRGATFVAVGDGSLWVSNPLERVIARIDPTTQQNVGSPIALTFEPAHLAYGEGAIWVVSAARTSLARIDPPTQQLTAVIDLHAFHLPTINHLWVAAGAGTVWLTNETTVIQVDPQTNQIVGEPIVAGEEIIAIAVGEGSFWTGSHDDGIVTRIDAATHRVAARIEVGFAVHGLAVGEGSVWVLDEHGFAVVPLNPVTNQLGEPITIDFVAANLTVGAGSVWVAPAAQDSGRATGNDGIVQIDTRGRKVVTTVHVGDATTSDYYSVFYAEGSVWVLIDSPEQTVVQIAP